VAPPAYDQFPELDSTMNLLQNKLALVTGAGGGLGSAIALGFAREGARVIVADIGLESAADVARQITHAGGQAWAEAIDVTDRQATHAWAGDIQSRIGAIDVLVNNAGISGRGKLDDPQAPALWDRILKVNIEGVFNVTHAFIPALKITHGNIVNLASIVSFASGVSTPGYVVSKGAVRSFTQVSARELAPFGIRVNAVAPGLMLTAMVRPQLDTPGGTDWYMHRAPMARGGQPEEVVGPIVFLASEMASYVNGVVLPVDGGFGAA
jgi:NAD(P)-dependent dehydrogenase (short-subunit alcohol dehydrogenase family)